jgi:hypothetical protein
MAEQKRWTVMLYMAAAQDERTEQAAMDDIKELEKVEIDDSKLNVLIQIDRQWPGYAERFRIEKVTGAKKGKVEDEKKGRSVPWKALKDRVRNIPDNGYISDAELGPATDSGQPKVLRDFVAAAREEYPDDYFLLVLWGHAYGLGFGRDHGDPLTLEELARSLDRTELNKQLAELGAPQIAEDRKAVDILGANACAMSYLEAAYELRHAAAFMVAPEIAMPFAGWPYDKILNEIIQTPGIEPQVLGEKIVAEFVKSFRRQDVALTLLNLDKAEGLKDPLKNLAGALRSSIKDKDKTKGEQIADAFLDTAHGDVRPLIDLYDLCEKLISIEELEVAAKKLREFLEPQKTPSIAQDPTADAQAGPKSESSESTPQRFVVMHDSNPNIEGLHGVGIYAPSLTGETTLTRLELDDEMYKALELMTYANDWPTLVYTELNTLLKPMNEVVRQLVKNTGATLREDRTGVAQLLLSVDRSFIKLEAAVNKTRGCVMSSLGNGKFTSSTLPTGTLSTDTVSTNQQKLTLAAARRLSRPYLRLATDFAETSYGGTPAASDVFDSLSGGPVEDIAKALESLEDVAASVERTIKKVLTNSTLGLGDGVKVRMGKPDMGKPDMGKPDMGKPDMGKPDMGKPDMGPFARFRTSASDSLEQPDGLSATELFRQAAAALRLLEEAIAELESDVRLFLTNPRLGTNGDGAYYERRSTEQLKLSFQTLNEVVANAKDIVFGILVDPSQGLGPAPEQRLITFNRHNLALAGGLSALDLSLL